MSLGKRIANSAALAIAIGLGVNAAVKDALASENAPKMAMHAAPSSADKKKSGSGQSTDKVGLFSPVISMHRLRHKLADVNAQYLPDLLEPGTTNRYDTMYARMDRDCQTYEPYKSMTATERALKVGGEGENRPTMGQSDILTVKASSKTSLTSASLPARDKMRKEQEEEPLVPRDDLPKKEGEKPVGDWKPNNGKQPRKPNQSGKSPLDEVAEANEEMKGSNSRVPGPEDISMGAIPKFR